jgi:hypothetical protein
MFEHAVKFGGLPFTRLLYHQAYTLRNAFPTLPMSQRLAISFKVRTFENGKEVDRRYVRTVPEAFPLLPRYK